MNRGVPAVCALLAVLVGTATSTPLSSPAHPFAAEAGHAESEGPPGRHPEYDVLDYALDLAIDPTARRIEGSVRVILTPRIVGVDRIVLDLVDNLSCDGVTDRTGDLAFTHAGDSLTVFLPGPLKVQRQDTLTVAYHGSPEPHGVFNAGFMWRGRDAGTPGDPVDDTPIIATVAEPWSAHSWWPCKDDPADKATCSLAVTVPDRLEAISNGALLGSEAAGPGLRRYRWREAYPIATYLVSVAVTDYVSWSEECRPAGGPAVPLGFHVFAEDSTAARADLAPTCAMLDMMTDIAGPWPFAGEKYDQAEIRWAGAMENQTATSISQFMLPGDGTYETTVIHELAHQWYGNSLTPHEWSDIWLNEGFARYCEALWVERQYGTDAYRDFMHDIGTVRHPDLFAGEGVLADPDPVLPNLLVYDKGAWVLHLLRLLIGDDAFFAFLRDYPGDPNLSLGGTDTAAMIAHAELAAGRSLATFFTPLLETDAVPVIQTDVTPAPAPVVHLVQRQDTLFELPVPVRIFTPTGTQDEVLDLAGRSQTFALSAYGTVDSVQVDPDSLSLMRRTPAANLALDVRGPFPNPATRMEFQLYLSDYMEVVVDIYDTRGRSVAHLRLGTLDPTGPPGAGESSPHVFGWPDGDASPAAGVYWARFSAGPHRAVRKFTVIH